MTLPGAANALGPLAFSLVVFLSAVNSYAQPEATHVVEFATSPALWNVRLSPDGSKISYLSSHSSGTPIALVWKVGAGKPKIVLGSEDDRFELSWCRWANEERLLCGYRAVVRVQGVLAPVTRLVAVDDDGTHVKVLMEGELRWQFAQFQDEVVDWLPDDPKHVLIEVPNGLGAGANELNVLASASFPGTGVSKLNIYTGSTRREAKAISGVHEWRSDGRGELRLRMSQFDQEIEWSYRLAGKKQWQVLQEHDVNDSAGFYSPVGFGRDPNQLLVYKRFEGRVALWSEDLENSRASKLVFAHPEVDVGGELRIGKFDRMVAVGYSTDRGHLHFFDDDLERISGSIAGVFPNQNVNVVDESWDKRFYLVNTSGDQNAGSYYRFDNQKSVLLKISEQYPQLQGFELSAMRPLRYAGRDGEQIQAYLTLPSSAVEGPVPAVIMPHGGPEARDYWGYDWLAQFIAARGYAVLQPNYRGSGGFGSDWSGAGGFRNWRVAIDDITDGALHLVETKVIDADRICVLGWSYGGYAALMSAIEEPQLYRCVVSIAGVTDPRTLIADARAFIGKRGLRDFVGTEREQLERGSPLGRASELAVPVLLFHGDRDINVQIGHSKQLVRALEAEEKSVEMIAYEQAGHSLRGSQLRVDLLTRIGAFLDQNTGPRSD